MSWLLVLLAVTVALAPLASWVRRWRRRSAAERRRLSRMARALEPMSAALESDAAAVFLVSEKLEVVYANPAATELLGRPLEGLRVDAVVSSLSPDLREALLEGQDTMVTQGEDEDSSAVLVSSRELRVAGRRHALYTIRPITQELRRQEVEHWKKLIRVLSHELSNSLAPITSLISSARKLAESTDRQAQLDKVFSTIEDRTRHLLDFLEGYRSVARLPRPTRRNVEWRPFIEALRAQLPFQQRGELPDGPGFFDPGQMERVLLNLLKNAHESGSPPSEISLRVVDEAEGTRIDVLDRGAGMSRTVLEQAMLPFYSTKRTGTGVGLALAREIVEAHRGQLRLANREGGGLIASVWLPARTDHLLSTM